jgi:hypothetical protein
MERLGSRLEAEVIACQLDRDDGPSSGQRIPPLVTRSWVGTRWFADRVESSDARRDGGGNPTS